MAHVKAPVDDGEQPTKSPSNGSDKREEAIRAGVLAALGRPKSLFRLAVLPLWGDHFRVNVITGDGPSSVLIPQSYFVAADTVGNIIESAPPLTRLY